MAYNTQTGSPYGQMAPGPPSTAPPGGGGYSGYGEQDGYGTHGAGNYEDDVHEDVLTQRPEEYLEEMSKKPAHMRRFSVGSFPHAHKNSSPQKMESGGEDLWAEPDPDEARFNDWSVRLREELNEMTHTVNATEQAIRNIKDGVDGDGHDMYGSHPTNYGPSYDENLLGEVLGEAYYNGEMMLKKGSGKGMLSRTNWKERFFRLSLSEDPTISYYDSQQSYQQGAEPKGKLHLTVTSTADIDYAAASKSKKFKKSDKTGLNVFCVESDSNPRMFNLLVSTPDRAAAWKQAIEHVVSKLVQYHDSQFSLQPSYGGESGAFHDDEQLLAEDERQRVEAMKDQAQNCEAHGAALYEATIGEPMDFTITVKDPLTQEPLGVAEAIMYQESLRGTLISIDEAEIDVDEEEEEKQTFDWWHRQNETKIRKIANQQMERQNEGNGLNVKVEALSTETLLATAKEQWDLLSEEAREDARIKRLDENELKYNHYGSGHLHYELLTEYDEVENVFKMSYTVSRVGHFRLKVMYDGHHIYGSPFHLVSVAGNTYAKMSTATGAGILFANPRVTNSFIIEARDKMGNLRTEGGDQFFVEYEGAGIGSGTKDESGFIMPIDNGDGTYTCHYNVDLEVANKMFRPTVSISIRIDDGSHFQPGSMHTLQQWKEENYEEEPEEYEKDEFGNDILDEYDQPVLSPKKAPVRPAWHVHIKGSPFDLPISDALPQYVYEQLDNEPVNAASGNAASGNAASPNQWKHLQSHVHNDFGSKSNAGQKLYDTVGQLQRAQLETMSTMFNAQSSGTLSSSLHQGPKLSYEIERSEGTMSSLLRQDDASKGEKSVNAQREAALAEREMEVRQQEEMLRNQARQVEEQKARMDDQMGQIQRMGESVTSSALNDSARNTSLSKSNSPRRSSGAGSSGDSDCDALFARFKQPLVLVFKYYAGSNGASMTLDQFMRIGQDYDLYPTFLTKAELNSFFVQAAQGHQSLVYAGFVDALRITAVVALGKKSFKNLYPSNSSRVHVLLSLWGVGDPMKLEQLKSMHQMRQRQGVN